MIESNIRGLQRYLNFSSKPHTDRISTQVFLVYLLLSLILSSGPNINPFYRFTWFCPVILHFFLAGLLYFSTSNALCSQSTSGNVLPSHSPSSPSVGHPWHLDETRAPLSIMTSTDYSSVSSLWVGQNHKLVKQT